MVARGCPVDGRRPDCLHFYRSKCDGQNRCILTVHAGAFAHNPLQNAVDLSFGRRSRFPRIPQPDMRSRGLLGCSQGPQGKSFANPRWPPRWPPARIPAFLRCPVASSKRAEKFKKKTLKLTSFLKKAVCKIHIDRRLESLHFNG